MVRKGFISLVFFLLVLAVWSSYMEGYQKTQRAQKTSEEAVKNCVSTLRNRVSARLDKILGSADIYLHNTVSGNYLQLSPLPEYYQGADVDPDVYWLHVTLRLHVQVEVLLPDENKSKSMDIDLYEVYSKSFNKFAEPLIISSCKGRYDTNVAFVSHRTSFLPFLSDAFAEEQKKGEDDGWQERITEEITKFAIKQAVKEVAGKLLGGVIGTIFDSKEIVSDEVEMAQLEAAKKKIAEEQARKRQMEAAADVLRREMFHNKALSGPKSSNNSSPNKPSSNKPPASLSRSCSPV